MTQFVAIVIYLSPLGLVLGYVVYRAHRIAMIERMGRQLYNETGGYSPLVEPAPDAFHYGDKVTVTSGVYSGMEATIDGEIWGGDYPVWIWRNGMRESYAFIHKKHLRLITPPQSVSAMIPYHATEREPMPELTDARLRMIASLEESGMFSVEKAARFRNAALLHANGAVSHMEDALLFGEDIIASLPETRPTAREASEAMQVMHAALLIPPDLPIAPYVSPYAKDELYEPMTALEKER